MTGFFRDGCSDTNREDSGLQTAGLKQSQTLLAGKLIELPRGFVHQQNI
jgi:uncharacterized protein (DUF2237 family)